jgi:hypothetical protein
MILDHSDEQVQVQRTSYYLGLGELTLSVFHGWFKVSEGSVLFSLSPAASRLLQRANKFLS